MANIPFHTHTFEIETATEGDIRTGSALVVTADALKPVLDEKGDMFKASYDPQEIAADVFDRTNHTGTQDASTIDGLATVATSGEYDDLANLPTLGSAAGQDAADFASAAQGSLADSAVQPGDLADVATSGEYADLDGLPTLGTAAATDATDYATAAQGELADTSVQIDDIGSSVQAHADFLDALSAMTPGTDGQVIAFEGGLPVATAAGNGDMLTSAYDPDGVDANVFDSANQIDFTRAQAVTKAIPAQVNEVRTSGYANPGDGGGARYKRVLSEPSHPGKFQSADGAWWEVIAAVPAVIPLFFGAKGDGATDDTSALQGMLDSIPAGSVVSLLGRTFKYTALTIAASISIINGTLASDTTSGVQITVSKTARLESSGVTFTGGGSESTYVSGHMLIEQNGSSSADRAVGMLFKNCIWRGSGHRAVSAKWSDDIIFENPVVTNCAYAGLQFLSCDKGKVTGGIVNILNAVGSAGRAYGVGITHDSLGYSSDPNAGTPLAANPFCNGWIIDGVTVIGPIIWQAIDGHGGYNNKVVNCSVFAAKHGILMGGDSSGGATGYAGYHTIIAGNIVDARNFDGTAVSGLVTGYGITSSGGAIFPGYGVSITGNLVRGFGAAGSTVSTSILIGTYLDQFECAGNVIEDWTGYGILMQGGGSNTGRISGNVFGPLRANDANSHCVNITGNFSGQVEVSGNHYKPGAYAPAFGLEVHTTTTGKVLVGENFFIGCTIAIRNRNGVTHGPGAPGTVAINAVSGVVTPDLSLGSLAPGIPLTLLFSGLSGAVSFSAVTNAVPGQIFNVQNEDATNSVTVTRVAGGVCSLPGSVNVVLDRYDSFQMRVYAAGQLRANSPLASNG